MRAIAAVGIDDYLSARETAVAVRSANDKPARRIDVYLSVAVNKPSGDDLVDNIFFDVLSQRIYMHVGRMLSGHDNSLDARYDVVNVLYADLRLAVGSQIFEYAFFAHFRQPLRELMRKIYRHRHQCRCLIAGITEHHSLIACAY